VAVFEAAVSVPGIYTGEQQAEFEFQVMRTLTDRLAGCIRSSDIAAQVARRTLLVILPGLGTAGDARLVAEGVVRTLRHPVSVGNRVLTVGVNAGVAVSGVHGRSARKLLDVARSATFEARKRPGKGTYVAEWRLRSKMFGTLRKPAKVERTETRRADDSRDWTGPRTER
jgi:GGDEF domain-containing protein